MELRLFSKQEIKLIKALKKRLKQVKKQGTYQHHWLKAFKLFDEPWDPLDEASAAEMIEKYNAIFSARSFSVDAGTAREFFKQINGLSVPANYPQKGSIELRIYLGSEKTGKPHNFVIVPVYNDEFEKDWMSNYKNNFIALVAFGSGQMKIANKIGDCSSYIKQKISKEYFVIKHSFESFGSLVNTSGNAFESVQFDFALSETSSLPVLVLTCRDANGKVVYRNTNGGGTTFDEGSLIPPPPLANSSF